MTFTSCDFSEPQPPHLQNKENKNTPKKDPDKKGKSPKPEENPSGNREKNSSPPPSVPSEEKKLDKEQARKLLELMAGDEKNLKDEMKERQKRMMRTNQVEKDW